MGPGGCAVAHRGPELYVGRVLPERGTGRPPFFAFHSEGPDGAISDPIEIRAVDGRLVLGPLHRD